MIHDPPPIAEILTRLRASASWLGQLLSLSDLPWLYQPAADEWSLTQILCHLRDVEVEVHQVRYEQVLNEARPFISGVSADEWARTRSYHKQDGAAALRAFLKSRKATLALLEGLAAEEWERNCRHAFLGITTLQELVFLALSHEEAHREQLMKILDRAGYPLPARLTAAAKAAPSD